MYMEFFGLQVACFNSTLDPRFFFSSPQHEEALASLIYAVQQRKGLVVVTGDVGSGKTLITRLLIHRLGAEADVAVINTSLLAGTDLLDGLCRELQVPIDAGFNTMEIVAALEEHLLLQASRDRTAVLVVDDAHNLADKHFEQLRLVSNLETAGGKLLQIVLAGQPDLSNLLQKPASRQLQQRVFRSFHIVRFTRDQTGQYIRFRLQTAGLPQAQVFDEQALDVIHQYAGGIPRLINNLCDNLMLSAFSDSVQVVDSGRVNLVIDEMMSSRHSEDGGSLHHRRDDLDQAISDITSQYVKSLEAQVSELQGTAADTDRRIHELHRLSAKLQAQELKLNEHQSAIDQKIRESHKLTATLGEQEVGLGRREKAIARQVEELNDLSQRLDGQDKRLAEREATLNRHIRDIERYDCNWKEIKDLVARSVAVHQRLEQFETIEAQLAKRESGLQSVLDQGRRLEERLVEMCQEHVGSAEQATEHLRQLVEKADLILRQPTEIMAKVERQGTQVERMARIIQQAGEGLHKSIHESLECSKRLSTEGAELCRRLEDIQDDALASMKDLETRTGKTHELREVLRQIYVQAQEQVNELKGVVVQAERVLSKLPKQLDHLRENALHPTRLVRELRDVGSATERNLHDGQVRLAELRMMIDKADKARRSIEALILASRRVAETRRPVPILDPQHDTASPDLPGPSDLLSSRIESLAEAVSRARSRTDLEIPAVQPDGGSELSPDSAAHSSHGLPL